ncbi:MAG: TIM barrel protein, partial [Pontimonas sp.]|nr:TIM barrel protein [Pontimonas sp.]
MSTVRIAGAPISWGVCEVPGWGHQMGPDRVLTEMAALGLEAMEFGPLGFLPEDAEGRKATLAKHNMSAVGGFFPVVLHDPGFDPLPSIEKELEAYVAADAEVLVLAAETGLDGYDAPRPEMAEENWQTMATNLTRISDYASSRGIIAVIHPHAGTMVETKADVDEVLARTSMPFCLDTGHMWIGGTDPVAFAKDHGDRVGHVHFKDVRLDIAQRVRDGALSYYDAVTEGLYTPLGQGDVDVKGITSTLISQGYTGWFVLEQD